MPVLFVHGVSEEMTNKLEEYADTLINTVAHSVKELNLKPSDVSCFFPKDLMSKGLGEEIIIFVDGLFIKPERTKEVRDRLATAVVQTTYEYFMDANLIECFIRPFDPKQGFKSFHKTK
ncbi:MAG: hypothetical protein NTX66_04415 [Candidatus Falkowbacteria bacterium]|nr:hypothetical protein [Candidatus Falkowbacteria bacterium]